MRIIDADALLDKLENIKNDCKTLQEVTFLFGIQAIVDSMPTIIEEKPELE